MFQIRSHLYKVQPEKEMLQNTITFLVPNKLKDLILNEPDISLLQIFQSLLNENDCVSVDKTPPRMVISTGFIYTPLMTLYVKTRLQMTGF